MTKPPEILVIGYVTKDINICGGERSENTGGAAYFVSLAASLFSKSVSLVARVGQDFKDDLISSQKLFSGLIYDAHLPTATSTQIYDDPNDLTNRKIILEQGASKQLMPSDLTSQMLKTAKIIHIATMPPEHQSVFVKYLVDKRKSEGNFLISIDTDIIFLQTEENIQKVVSNLQACDIVFLNRREYQKLKEHMAGHPNLIIKEDQDGAYWLERDRIITRAKAPKLKAVDVTGAGDIFAGTFLANFLSNKEEALQQAVHYASESVTEKGINHLFGQK